MYSSSPLNNFCSCRSFCAAIIGCVLLGSKVLALSPSLQATGLYSELGNPQFMLGLYAENKFESANALILSEQEKAIEIRVVASKLYARRFRRMWQEGAAINTSLDEFRAHSKNMVDFGQFLQINFDQNDIFRMRRQSSGKMEVLLNGVILGQIDDPDFFDILLRVVVGPVPISNELKESLVVGGAPSAEQIERFESIAPSAERRHAISTIVGAKEEKVLAHIDMDIDQPELAAKTKATPVPAAATAQKTKRDPVKPQTELAKVSPPKKKTPKKELSIFEQVALDNKGGAAKKTPPAASVDLDMLGQNNAESSSAADTAIIISSQQASNSTPKQPKRALNEGDVSNIFSSSERIAYLIARKGYFSEVVDKISQTVNGKKSGTQRAGSDEGKTVIRITISVRKGGEIDGIKVLNPSRNEKVNEAAKLAIFDSAPLPAFPENISDQMLDMTIPIAVDDAYLRALNNAGRI